MKWLKTECPPVGPGEHFRVSRPGWLMLFCIACSLGWVSGCGGEGAEAPTAAEMIPPVMLARAIVRDVQERIDATGQLLAQAEATVAAQVPGQITSVLVEEGDAVLRGQILLEIDPQLRLLEARDAGARLAEARAQVLESQRDVDRMRNLNRRDAASQARLDDTETALVLAHSRETAAEARLGLAERALADATVRAPLAGRVARRHANAGEFLGVGMPLFEIVSLDPIEVEFSLSEVDSGRVRLGQRVEIGLAPFPDETFPAIVIVISPTIETRTRTLRVKAELPNPDHRLRPGLFAHVELGVAERAGVVMVPEESILQRADGSFLYRLVGRDRVQKLKVETGLLQESWLEIREGISGQDMVVVRGQGELVDGGKVSIRKRDGRPVDEPQLAAPSPPNAPGTGG